MGRKTLLTAEITREICLRLQAGAFLCAAAESSGVGRSTVYEWLRRAEQPRAPKRFRAFLDAVRKARAAARFSCEARVHRDAPHSWLKAAAREDWGDHVSADVQTNVTAEVNTTLADSFLNLVVAGLQELEAIGLLQISERGQPLLRSPTDAAPQIEEGELFDPEPNDKLPGSTDLGATHIDAPKEVTPPAPGGNGQQPKQET